MASAFDRAMRAADARIVSLMGESILAVPRVAFRGRDSQVDVLREEGVVQGVFTLSGAIGNLGGTAGPAIHLLASAETIVWFPNRSIESLGWVPQKNDELHLISRPNSPTYVVVEPYPSDQNDVFLHVTRKSDELVSTP